MRIWELISVLFMCVSYTKKVLKKVRKGVHTLAMSNPDTQNTADHVAQVDSRRWLYADSGPATLKPTRLVVLQHYVRLLLTFCNIQTYFLSFKMKLRSKQQVHIIVIRVYGLVQRFPNPVFTPSRGEYFQELFINPISSPKRSRCS